MTSAVSHEHMRLIGSSNESQSSHALFPFAFKDRQHDFAGLAVGLAGLDRPALHQDARSLFGACDGPESTPAILFKGDGLVPSGRSHNAKLHDAKLATQRVFSGDVPPALEVSGRVGA
jgi:hypothetical protein